MEHVLWVTYSPVVSCSDLSLTFIPSFFFFFFSVALLTSASSLQDTQSHILAFFHQLCASSSGSIHVSALFVRLTSCP